MFHSLRENLSGVFILVFMCFAPEVLQAQVGCTGFDGAPQPSGGVNSISNGTICLNANSPLPAEIEIVASNVADGNNPNNFAVVINWDDGSPEQVIAFGGPIPVLNTGPHAYRIPSIKHEFLPRECTGPNGRQCAYKPRVYLRIAGTTCSAEFGNPPDFFRFNTDDQCSGNMELSETTTGAQVFEVCAGASTTVTFTDRTILNCLPPEELTGLNSTKRWRRFVYGTVNTISGAVLIDGTPQAFPYNAAGPPDESGNGLTNSAPPFGVNTSQSITIPATATVGQEFHIRMEYWNFCNPFTGGEAPVSVDGIIRIVDQPAAPTPVHQVVCNNTSPLPAFRVDFTTASTAVLWYRDNGGVPGTAITNPNGANNKSLPASAFPGGITPSTPVVYTVWASYRAQIGAGALRCESVRVPVTLTIRESIPIPGPISGTASVCNGTSGVSYAVPILAANMPVGGATEYDWQVVDENNTVVNDVAITPQPDGVTLLATFTVPNAAFGSDPSVLRKIRVRRRYTDNSTFPSGSTCPSPRASFPVTVFRNTDDGSITGGGSFCQGADLGDITWNAGVGTIQRWEISSNSGATYTPVGSFGTSNPVSATSLNLGPGTYFIRAIVQNGVCPQDETDHVTYTITANPDVAVAGADQDLCIPATDPLIASLSGNAPAASVTASWSMVSGPGTATFADPAEENTTVQVSAPGNYVFRWTLTAGICTSVDDVEIRFGREPDTPVPSAVDACGLTGVLNAVAPANNENILWSLDTGPGTATFIDAHAIPATVTVSVPGTYVFDLTFSSGGCTPSTAAVSITFAEPVTALPESDKMVCVDGATLDPIAVTGTIGGGAAGGGTGQGQWEIAPGSGSGIFMSSGVATGSLATGPTINDSYRPSAADYATGFVVLQLRATGSICADGVETVRIDFDKKPAAAAVGADIAVCGSSATLNGVAPTEGGIGSWSVLTAGPTIADLSDRASAVQDLQFGANQFQWTVTSASGVCASTSAIFTINRISAPVVNNISPDDLCETNANTGIQEDVDLAAQYDHLITGGAAGVDVLWFTNAARTIAVADVTHEDVMDGVVYYVRVQTQATPPAPVCYSDGVVNFKVNPKPFVANLNPSRCEAVAGEGFVHNVNLPAEFDGDVALNVGNRSVAWFMDAGLTTPVATPGDVDNVATNTTFYAQVTNTITGCYNVAQVTFTIHSIPENNPIIGPDKVCLDPDNVIFFKVTTFKANHTYQWNIPSPPNGAVNVTGINDDFFVLLQFPDLVPGGIDISVVETSPAGCTGTSQVFHIEVEDNPNSLTIAGPSEVCEGQELVEFTADLFPDISYFWSVPPGASIITGQNTNTISVNFGPGAGTGNVTVTPSTSSGCVGTGEVFPVTINAKPILAPFTDEICSKELANLHLSTVSGGEPAAHYNIVTRVNDAGLFQTSGVSVPPGGIMGGSFDVLEDQAFENITGGPLNVRYTIEPVSNKNCIGAREVVTLVINAEPQLDANLGKDLCSEEATGITLRPAVGSYPADEYVILSFQNPDGLTTVDPLPPLNTPLPATAIRDDQWINPGAPSHSSAFSTVHYEIAPRNSGTGCVGDPAGFVEVRVFPKPIFDPVTNPATICSGDSENVSLTTNNVASASIAWTLDYIGPAVSGATGNVSGTQPARINEVLTNSGTMVDYVRYRVQAENAISSVKSCFSDPLMLRIDVNPSPTALTLNPFEVCSDAANNGLIHTADLTIRQNSVSPPDGTTLAFNWFENYPGTPINDPTAYAVTHNVPVYLEVTNVASTCKKVVPVVYSVNNQVELTLNATNLICHQDNSGSIDANATAGTGTAPFSYSLDGAPYNTSSTNYVFSFLTAGHYTVMIRDSKGCAASGTVTLTEPSLPLQLTTPVVTNASCYFDTNGLDRNGKIELQASGGTENNGGQGYTYTLQPGTISNNTGVFTGLRPGVYSVSVKDETSVCQDEAFPITITAPDPLEITSVTVAQDAFGNNISCNGATNGRITVTAEGGNNNPASYSFDIAPLVGMDLLNPIPGDDQAPVVFTNMGAGTYGIVVTDDKGCKSPRSITFIAPLQELDAGLVGIDAAVCINQDDAAAFTELAPATGGTGVYEYQWQQSLDGDVSNDNVWFDIAGANDKTFDPDASAPFSEERKHYYRRLVTNVSTLPDAPAFCSDPAGKNKRVTITVNPLPKVIFDPLDDEICEGSPLVIQVGIEPGTGTLPLTYNYSTADYTVMGEISSQIIVPNMQQNNTFTLLEAKDANGCMASNTPIVRPIEVVKLNADFVIDGPDAQCPGSTFTFKIDGEAGVKYRWEWSDGSAPTEYTAVADGEITEHHIFSGGSTSASTTYPVKLLVSKSTCPPKPANKEVTVYPSIILNMIEGPAALCSGETFRIEDKSLGVDNGTWYIEDGVNPRQKIMEGPVPVFEHQVINNTSANPLTYTISYEAKNDEGCVASPLYSIPVQVYPSAVAAIAATDAPPLSGGASVVSFTNNSSPLDFNTFEYTWNFGEKSRILNDNGTLFEVEYVTAGLKEVTLSVINLKAQADIGRSCSTPAVHQFNIDIPELDADFTVTPLARCLPAVITVVNNSPGADTFKWILWRDGVVADSSTVRHPVWRITSAGTYSITLEASYAASNQPPVVKEKTGIKIYDNPVAIFELMQSQIYIPGTEVRVDNRSVGASEFSWNFGDHPEEENSILITPTHYYTEEGKYIITLTAINNYGPHDLDGDGVADGDVVCTDQTQREIFAKEGGTMKVPNAFTPNTSSPTGSLPGDGSNDIFLPIMDGVEEFTMQIFDRWGTLIFESKDKRVGWNGYDRNGRLMPAGVYVYKLVMRLGDNSRTTKVGDVTLIR